MNEQYIKGVGINWDKVSEDSYIREIDAISNMDYMPFDKAITFFVGENGTGKSTLLEAIAVAYGFNPEGGTKNYDFLPMIPTPSCVMPLSYLRVLVSRAGDIFSEPKVFTMWQLRKKITRIGGIPQRVIIESPTGKVFLP